MSVYLDHNATTPLEREALEAMLPYLGPEFGNASSVHRWGRAARAAIDRAREQVAGLVNAQPAQVIFTSGGTEANNLALQGATAAANPGVLAVSAIEHASVRAPAQALRRRGWETFELGVDGEGRVARAALDEAWRAQPRIVSVMLANNETGVVQDVAGIAHAARSRGAIVHTDAAQAAGKIAVDFAALGVHMMTLSAHKLYGPKGVGALVVDKALDVEPLLAGGGQEAGRRAGTENVAGIVGFGAAAAVAQRELERRRAHAVGLRGALEARLGEIAGVVVFSAGAARLPNTVFLAVPRIEGETLVMNLDREGIAVASGSACASADPEPSHVLLAMGVERDVARCAVRVSLGKDNTQRDCDAFIAALRRQIEACDALGALAGV